MPDRHVPIQQARAFANLFGQLPLDVQLETGHANAQSVCASKERRQSHWAMIVHATAAGRRFPLAIQVSLEVLQAVVILCNAHWSSIMTKASGSAMNQQTTDARTCQVSRRVWLLVAVLIAVLSVYLA
jgi:uncharacterized Tic20 family protein